MEILKYLSVELTLCISGLILIICDIIFPKRKNLLSFLSVCGIIIAGYFLFTTPTYTEDNILKIDNFSKFFNGIFLLLCVLTILTSIDLLRTIKNIGSYLGILLFATAGMCLLSSANELLSLFVFLEIVSISGYILVGMLKGRESSEAAMKYLIFGVLSSCIFLYGISLIYGKLQTTYINDLAKFSDGSDTLLIVSILFMLVGIGFKIGCFPFCFWVPDVYQGATAAVVGFLSTAFKATGVVILIKILFDGFYNIVGKFHELLSVLSAVTMCYGSVIAIIQTNIKRLFGYSSISHIGFILIGVSIASLERQNFLPATGPTPGLMAVLFYILIYSITNIGIFAVISATSRLTGDKIANYAGLARYMPTLGFFMVIYLVSLAGIPPLGGFIGKFYLFATAVKEKVFWLAILGIVFSVVSIFYYFNILKEMYINTKEANDNNIMIKLPLSIKIVCILTVFAIIGIGLFPEGILRLCRFSFAG